MIYPLLPLRHRAQVHLAHILARRQVITVQVAPVDPVGHPDHIPVAVYGQPAHLDLPRGRFPVDRPLPRQVAGIVHGDLDILTLAVVESLNAGINLTVPYVDIADMVRGERQPFERLPVYGRPAVPACRTCRAPYCPKRNSSSSRRRSPAVLRPGKPATGGTPRPTSAPGVRFRPPTRAIQKKFVSSLSAILFGNHILDTPGLTARIFVPHSAPLDFRAPNPAPRIHTRLRTQAAVVPPPGPRPKLRPAPRQLRPCCPDFFIPGCAPRQLLCSAPAAPAARSFPERFPEGASASPSGNT